MGERAVSDTQKRKSEQKRKRKRDGAEQSNAFGRKPVPKPPVGRRHIVSGRKKGRPQAEKEERAEEKPRLVGTQREQAQADMIQTTEYVSIVTRDRADD
jgi:hypothetical protein